MMNEYWVVTENKTGKVIAHCGDIKDAIMMVSFDLNKRSYRKQKFILDQIIDVTSTTDKQLPGQIGLPSGRVESIEPYKEKLPQGNSQPVII